MNQKIIVAGIVIILIVLISVIIFYFLNANRQTTSSPNFISPTPIPLTTDPSGSNLVLVLIDPPEDLTGEKFYGSSTRIVFTFNKPVNPTSAAIETSPSVNLVAIQGDTPSQLVVQTSTTDFYKPDILYTVTLKSGLKAIDGSILQQDINYRIMTRLQGGV